MTVRIDELVTEMAEEPSAQRGAGTAQAAAATRPADDLDRLEPEFERRKHRLARLWAD